MKSTLVGAACIGLAAVAGNVPLFAQLHDNTEKQMSCQNGGNDGDRARHCEIREQTVAAIGRLSVDSGPNGGATIKGWQRGDVLVRSRIEASGETQAEAALMVSKVWVDGSGGQVKATGPESSGRNSGWSVSYEIFVPQNTDLDLKTTNGGMTVSDVRGQLHFDVVNGGVHLKRVAGDVSGSTVNGGVQVELTGAAWEGRQLEVSTHNGGVTVTVPASYSAHVQAETGMGSVSSDFPLPLSAEGNGRPRKLDFNLGSGGPLIHITTGNGGIRLKRADTQ